VLEVPLANVMRDKDALMVYYITAVKHGFKDLAAPYTNAIAESSKYSFDSVLDRVQKLDPPTASALEKKRRVLMETAIRKLHSEWNKTKSGECSESNDGSHICRKCKEAVYTYDIGALGKFV